MGYYGSESRDIRVGDHVEVFLMGDDRAYPVKRIGTGTAEGRRCRLAVVEIAPMESATIAYLCLDPECDHDDESPGECVLAEWCEPDAYQWVGVDIGEVG